MGGTAELSAPRRRSWPKKSRGFSAIQIEIPKRNRRCCRFGRACGRQGSTNQTEATEGEQEGACVCGSGLEQLVPSLYIEGPKWQKRDGTVSLIPALQSASTCTEHSHVGPTALAFRRRIPIRCGCCGRCLSIPFPFVSLLPFVVLVGQAGRRTCRRLCDQYRLRQWG
jgi:hypothetical protein